MELTRINLVKFLDNKKDFTDRRKRVAWAVFSYVSKNGYEYRRGFTAPVGTSEIEFWDIAPKIINI